MADEFETGNIGAIGNICIFRRSRSARPAGNPAVREGHEAQRMPEACGRRAIGWDEILDAPPGALPSATMGMYWHHRGAKRTARAAKAGHELVACVSRYCYFDYGQGLADDPHRYIGGNIPLDKVYAFDPLGAVDNKYRRKVVGGQCNNWAEFTYDGKDLEWKLWPRGLALAEVLWTYPAPKKRDFAEFKRRAAVRRDAMAARGVNAAPVN